jgi:hypothetical protein
LLDLLDARPQELALFGQAVSPLGQCGQRNDCRLIGIDSARFLAFQGRYLALQPGAFVFRPYIHWWIAVALFILLPSHLGIGE